MKQHALCIATAFAVAALGTAGLASARPDGAAPAATAADAARVEAAAERPHRHGKHHPGHRGHRGRAMHGGIERMDADGDGRVSRAEFDAARAGREQAREARGERAPRNPDGRRAHMRMALDFDAIDANRDGYIVRAEVAAHRERMRTRMREAAATRFAEAFAAADLNRDGRLSRVEVDEKMPRLSKRFAWMDDNRDGFLDRAELEAGRSR